MRNFHLTRIAVNLSLIVALAIQPLATCAVTAECSVRCSASDTVICPGCGCCEVEDANDQCCCCTGTAEGAAEQSCCSHDEMADADVFGPPSADSETPEPPCELSDSDDSQSSVQSLCLCEQNSQPLSDSSPRRPVSEIRTSFAIAHIGPVGADRDHRLSIATARGGTNAIEIAHFSQIVLCIWRL